MDITQGLTSLWSSPLNIVFCQYFLWQYLGPASLSGLVLMVLTIPLDALIARQLKKLQIQNLSAKDSRIRYMHELLDSVKLLKLYTWEQSFSDKIGAIRAREIKILKKNAIYTAIFTLMLSAIPTFVAIVSFATFVMIDPANNVLTAEIAFVSLSYFNIVRIPLVSLPYVIVQLVQTQVSIDRLNNYLNSSEADGTFMHRFNDSKYAVTLSNASFAWSYNYNNLSLKVEEVLYVVLASEYI